MTCMGLPVLNGQSIVIIKTLLFEDTYHSAGRRHDSELVHHYLLILNVTLQYHTVRSVVLCI